MARKVYLVFYHPQPYFNMFALYSIAEIVESDEMQFQDDWTVTMKQYEARHIPIQGIAFFAPVEDIFKQTTAAQEGGGDGA